MKRFLPLLFAFLLVACSASLRPAEPLPLDEAAEMQEQKPEKVMQKKPEESAPDEDFSFGEGIEGAMESEEESTAPVSAPPTPEPEPEPDPAPVTEPEPEPKPEPESEPEVMAPQSHVVNMSVKSWAFSPSTVMAKQGEDLQIQLSGISGTHGFAIDALGVSETISSGETKTVSIPTDQPGTYEFYCTVQCGAGHSGMRGMLVIE